MTHGPATVPSTNDLVVLRDVEFDYGSRTVLRDVDLTVQRG